MQVFAHDGVVGTAHILSEHSIDALSVTPSLLEGKQLAVENILRVFRVRGFSVKLWILVL